MSDLLCASLSDMIRLDTDRYLEHDFMRLTKAAQEIGVSPITLKRWLLSGKVEDVARDKNNWRHFREEDIYRIKAYHLSGTSEALEIREPGPFDHKVASFFSGIGGFEIGFEKAGFTTSMQCEIEPFCREILTKHWPDTPKFEDIRELNGNDIPTSTVWVGGFPCQDLSLARMGKRAGLKGSRSGLFHEFARLVGESKPRILVIENVAGLLSSHKGEDFAVLLSTLAELGYAVGWRTFNSKNFGVPQSRQRVYIVGCYRDGCGPSEILFEPQRSPRDSAKGGQNGKKPKTAFQEVIGDPCGDGPVIQSIAYCLYATSARHTGTDWSRNYVCYPKIGMVRRLVPSECEGVMAFPRGWTIPPSHRLEGDDLDSARYHALGNAVTPPVAEWLAYRIRNYLEGKSAWQ
ncbi:DNA (cytosine-5-)-methyltransferase [Wenzhouxiangella sp. AB-CW3]|uniref:DNA (cytosine-5-)-methyltransferase n=1 Tax=Wenzhouxiangella sp. AB-CW3 TaxID=2771012 RepID=UPI00168A6E60|nr:DNA (cytosine-5-)-methyltransferase [Wenzhouxiangella sp. AB-CW3]QOC22581.1 DNA (cytosine-5-)-methyltransferase [Wenzhouxiangella sp. AB-CW3]